MIEQGSLKRADLPACMALSADAGWNQTEDDWHTILTEGLGLGIWRDGELVATAALLSYANTLGWIGMVLVARAERRQGHASTLMNALIVEAERQGLIAGLDATPEGKLVYKRLGFTDIYPLTRFTAQIARSVAMPLASNVQLLDLETLPEVLAYDTPVFGLDRSAVLEAILRRAPALGYYAREEGRIRGFVLARNGRTATHIGPLVADREEIARALLSAALRNVDNSVLIDVPDRHTNWSSFLERSGFIAQRTFTRMLRCRSAPIDHAQCIFAVTGPEFA